MRHFRTALISTTSAIVIATSLAKAAASNADNSQRNQDTNVEMNAQDQGNSEQDLKMTQKIRQAIMRHKTFSMDAKNIKIISLNGVVTVKGPVETAFEKKQIEKIATRVAGDSSKVVNEIEVKQ